MHQIGGFGAVVHLLRHPLIRNSHDFDRVHHHIQKPGLLVPNESFHSLLPQHFVGQASFAQVHFHKHVNSGVKQLVNVPVGSFFKAQLSVDDAAAGKHVSVVKRDLLVGHQSVSQQIVDLVRVQVGELVVDDLKNKVWALRVFLGVPQDNVSRE